MTNRGSSSTSKFQIRLKGCRSWEEEEEEKEKEEGKEEEVESHLLFQACL